MQSFHQLKAIITSFPVLRSPDFSKPFELSVDASDVGIGAMLVQPDNEGIKHPVAYYSKKITIAQQKYSTIEKETLGLILALSHLRCTLVEQIILSKCLQIIIHYLLFKGIKIKIKGLCDGVWCCRSGT